MSIKDFFDREKISPLLKLPDEMREKLFSGTHLSRREKYVMANLYYLDSWNKLDEYKSLLPAMADMELSECLESIDILEEEGFISRKGQKIILRIKPITYK